MFRKSGASSSNDRALGKLNSTFSSHWGCVSVPRVDTDPFPVGVVAARPASLAKASILPRQRGCSRNLAPLTLTESRRGSTCVCSCVVNFLDSRVSPGRACTVTRAVETHSSSLNKSRVADATSPPSNIDVVSGRLPTASPNETSSETVAASLLFATRRGNTTPFSASGQGGISFSSPSSDNDTGPCWQMATQCTHPRNGRRLNDLGPLTRILTPIWGFRPSSACDSLNGSHDAFPTDLDQRI